jgi:hypothetical protein
MNRLACDSNSLPEYRQCPCVAFRLKTGTVAARCDMGPNVTQHGLSLTRNGRVPARLQRPLKLATLRVPLCRACPNIHATRLDAVLFATADVTARNTFGETTAAG